MESIGNPLITPSMKGWPPFPQTLNAPPRIPRPGDPPMGMFQQMQMQKLYQNPPQMASQQQKLGFMPPKPPSVPSLDETIATAREEGSMVPDKHKLTKAVLVLGGIALAVVIPYTKFLKAPPYIKNYMQLAGIGMLAAGGLWMLLL